MLKIALQSLRERKFRTFLSGLSVIISTASLILLLGLSQGIKNATFEEMEKQNPLTQITVRPNVENTGIVSFLTPAEGKKLNAESLEKISKIKGIKNIYPEIQFKNFASIEAKLLGFTLITDSMVFGVPKNFIKDELKDETIWDKTSEPYPALIPRKLLDLYNVAIAAPQGLPLISEKKLHGKKLTLYPNYSTFFPGLNKKEAEITLEVVGFSDKINLLGATLPYQIVEDLNKKYAEAEQGQPSYLEFFIETENEDSTAKIAQEIENLGFSTEYFQKNIQGIEGKFTYLTISLGTISFIIIIISAIAIISVFLSQITERTKEIGLFRALGATKFQIKQIILIEAGLIGFISSIFGTILGAILSLILNKFISNQLLTTLFIPKNIFSVDIKLIFLGILFGTFFSLFSAYIPAQKASKINPISAIK